MELPTLLTGKRFTLPRPAGSSDALLLARLAASRRHGGGATAIVCADRKSVV